MTFQWTRHCTWPMWPTTTALYSQKLSLSHPSTSLSITWKLQSRLLSFTLKKPRQADSSWRSTTALSGSGKTAQRKAWSASERSATKTKLTLTTRQVTNQTTTQIWKTMTNRSKVNLPCQQRTDLHRLPGTTHLKDLKIRVGIWGTKHYSIQTSSEVTWC